MLEDVNNKLLLANSVGLVLNLLLATVLAVGLLGDEPTAPAGATVSPATSVPAAVAPSSAAEATGSAPVPTDGAPPSGGAPPPPPDGPERTARFLDDTLTPLQKAGADMGRDMTGLLPSESEIAAAKATGSLSSPESQAVIATLQSAYGQFNMPFPEVPLPGSAPSAGGTTPPDTPEATTTNGGEQDILRAYFTVTLTQVRTQAEADGADISALLPANADVEAAIATGNISSEASKKVLDALRAAHTAAGLTFREPAVQ